MQYQMIDSQADLQAMCNQIDAASSLAVDMEMENNFHHYGLHLALIQIATPGNSVFIIDPLAISDLRPIGQLLTGSRRELIMHGADFDRRTCFQLHGWILGRTFDTQIAAMFCGFKQPGLAGLCSQLLGLKIDKRFQKQDWLKRPLTKPALEYAARDVNMLHCIRDRITVRLGELKRMEWAREEFQRAEKIFASDLPLPDFCRLKHSASLSPRQLAVLKSLFEYRERMAKCLDKPPHYVMRESILLDLARRPPENEEKIRSIRGMHPAVYRKSAVEDLLRALRTGMSAPDEIHPARRSRRTMPPCAPGWEAKLKEMRHWRMNKAAELGLEPHLVIESGVMEWRARHPGTDFPPYVAAMVRNWQKTHILPEFDRHFA